MIQYSTRSGFSLLELLIVIAIIGVIGAIGVGSYRSFTKSVELSSVAQGIASDLKQMQAKSMIGDGGYRWGVRFVNGTTTDYYFLFSTAGTTYTTLGTTTATTTLPSTVVFSDPQVGGIKDIIFEKISGTPLGVSLATTTVLVSEGMFATTTVTAIGAIY